MTGEIFIHDATIPVVDERRTIDLLETTLSKKCSADSPLRFVGDPGVFFKMLWKGAALQLPTLGFYRFWLITDIRRHLWANTRLGCDTFEYTGRPKELLVGFLIAMAIVAPVSIAYAIAGIIAESYQALASIPLALVFWTFGHFVVYRARAYRASRTSFRGLRFWMTGSAWTYAGRAMLWDVVTVLTLGVAHFWRAAALERYKMENTRFGDLRGRFIGTGGDLLRHSLVFWLCGFLGVLASGLVALVIDPDVMLAAILSALIVAIAILYPFLLAVRARWQIGGIRFGSVQFRSGLMPRAVFWIYLKSGLIIVGFLIASGLVLSLPALAVTQLGGEISMIVFMGFGYLIMLLGIGVLKRFFIDRGLWELVVDTTTVANIAALDEAVACGQLSGSLGEGLADAFDMASGF